MTIETFCTTAIMGLGYLAGDGIKRGHYGWAGLCIACSALLLVALTLTILGY